MVKFQVVPERSQLSLAGKSSLHPIHTSTNKIEGYLEAEVLADGRLDLSVAPTGRFEIPVESMKAGNDLYDLEMQRRLDIRRYPNIVAELLGMSEVNRMGHYQASGNLTFHGITRRFEGELTVKQLDDHTLEVSGERTFDVRDFNVTPPKLLMLKVYPEVQVSLKVMAKRMDS